jgi:hypothetical protein
MAGYTPEVSGTNVEGAAIDTFAMGVDLSASWVGFLPFVILGMLILLVGAGIIVRLVKLTIG